MAALERHYAEVLLPVSTGSGPKMAKVVAKLRRKQQPLYVVPHQVSTRGQGGPSGSSVSDSGALLAVCSRGAHPEVDPCQLGDGTRQGRPLMAVQAQGSARQGLGPNVAVDAQKGRSSTRAGTAGFSCMQIRTR
jgi:hypothetical protein